MADYNKQTNYWDESDDNDDSETGCCHNCGSITVVFKSVKDGRTYCLNGCKRETFEKVYGNGKKRCL
jgi:hypothetical protein